MGGNSTIEAQRPVAEELALGSETHARIVRKVARAKFAGRVTFRHGNHAPDIAAAENLGHGDISLECDRFLPPGEKVYLGLNCLTYRGEPIPLETEVVCCRRAYDRRCFVAIVHMV